MCARFRDWDTRRWRHRSISHCQAHPTRRSHSPKMRPRRCRLRRRRPRAFPGRQPSSLRQVLLDSPACAERLRGAAPPLLAPPIRVLAYYHVCLRGDRGGGARVGGAGGDTPLTVFRLLRGARAASEPERGGGSLGEEQGALRATACVSHASAKTIHPTAAPSTAPIPRRRSPRVHTLRESGRGRRASSARPTPRSAAAAGRPIKCVDSTWGAHGPRGGA